MFSFKNYLFFLPLFCLTLFLPQQLAAYHHVPGEISDEPNKKAQALMKQLKKIHKPTTNTTESAENGDHAPSTQQADDITDEEDPSIQGMSDTTKILIGLCTVGVVSVALFIAAVKKMRDAEVHRLRHSAPNATETQNNERLWEQAEERARLALPTPPAPAEITGPALRNIEDIQADPFYWEHEPLIRGFCHICYDLDAHIVPITNGGFNYCRNCLLHTILHAYNNARSNFDRISPNHGIILTREDIQRITQGNERMLNAFDIAQHNRLHPNVQAHLAEVTAQTRRISRPCPHCAAPIQRNGGCRHMTCRCGHEFCWHCLRDCPGGFHAYPDCNGSFY